MMIKVVIYAILTYCLCQTYGELEYELSGNFEGDMILTPQQELAILHDTYFTTGIGVARNGLISKNYRWPHNTVPYSIETDDFTDEQVAYIRKAMDEIESVSCVRFVEADDDSTEHVEIIGSQRGCSSAVGKRRKNQFINYQPNEIEKGCFRLVALMHELLHTLGFYHMQSAPNRDDYLIIMWDNIKEGQKHNFKKYSRKVVTAFNVPYDYDSIMHYPGIAFSANGEPTMIPIDESVVLGTHDRLSEGDITKINRMYRCEGHKNWYKFEGSSTTI